MPTDLRPLFDVITFGETMIRLSPPGRARLEVTPTLEMRIGGSESNTAVALRWLGRSVTWWSKLPRNPLGRRVEQEVRRWGVDTSGMQWSGEGGRVGTYYIEFGSPPRPHQITYDRAGSAASTMHPDDTDWSTVDGSSHMHLTGITPALSESCAAMVERGIQEAKRCGITVSFDVNYRSKLWPPERAGAALAPLLTKVDLVICSLEDAQQMFGITGDPLSVVRELRARSKAGAVVVTAGADGSYGMSNRETIHVPALEVEEVDRVGSGDAFDAGVIDGFLDGELERGMRYGAVMAALKRTMPGDQLITTHEEIEKLLEGGPAGIHR